jgi:hypothetical protein
MHILAHMLACTVAMAPAVLAGRLEAQTFEGVINTQMTLENGRTVDGVYQIKGNKSRWEGTMPGAERMGGTAMIFDGEAGTMTTVMPAQKMYMVMNVREMAKGMPESDTKFPKMTKTGKKERIAGHPCEHWLMGDDQKMDVCLAKGLGFFGMGGGKGRGGLSTAFPTMERAKLEAQVAAHPEVKELVEGGAFPLKMEDGDRKFSMIVTKIEKKSLADDLFRAPAGYQEMNMGRLMQQMQQQKQKPTGQGKPPS